MRFERVEKDDGTCIARSGMDTTLVVRAKDDGLVFKHFVLVGRTHGSNHTIVAHPGPSLDMCYSLIKEGKKEKAKCHQHCVREGAFSLRNPF